MAAKRKIKTSMLEDVPAMTPVMPSLPVEKPLLERLAPVLLLLVIAMAFAMGTMWTKLQGGGGGSAQGGSGKYKTFEAAMTDVLKKAGVKSGWLGSDVTKVVACMNTGGKKEVVESDSREGASLGVNGTPGFFVNGRFLGGAFPFESFKEVIDKELEGKGSDDCKAYSEVLQKECARGSFNPAPKNVAVGNASTKGPSNAKVTVVEFSDFQCPFCSRAKPTVDQILKTYGDNVQFAYKHFPLNQIHPRAQKAAELAECARDLDKFWQVHDQLFEMQQDWSQL